MSNEVRAEAMERSLPIPHADAQHDDGLPLEETLPDASMGTDIDFSFASEQYSVPYGNGLPKNLDPLEQTFL